MAHTHAHALTASGSSNSTGNDTPASSHDDREPVRVTVLISGSGSNLQALIDAANSPALPHVRIVRVISDRKSAYGLERAAAAGIPTTYHGILPYKKKFAASAPLSSSSDATSHTAAVDSLDPSSSTITTSPSSPTPDDAARQAYDADLAAHILADRPTLVICAGFMRIVTAALLDPLRAARTAIINLHPALHGDLVGAHCIERAWDEFVAGRRRATGIMVHHVIPEVDLGAPIVQQEVAIEGCANLEALQARMHAAEHQLIVRGARMVLEELRGQQVQGLS